MSSVALLRIAAMLAGGGRIGAQSPTPVFVISASPMPTPGLTNVGGVYYVDNGLIYMGPRNVR